MGLSALAIPVVVILTAGNLKVTSALSCNIQPTTYLNETVASSPQQCPSSMSGSCLKIIDSTAGTVSRSCNTLNCSSPNSNSTEASCVTTSQAPLHNIVVCCCYGDGCNASSHPQSIGSAMLLVVVVLALLPLAPSPR